MASKSKSFLNFFIKLFGYSNLWLLLVANLSLADLERLFLTNSFLDGRKTLFLYSLNNVPLKIFSSGKYLDGLDLFVEKFVKKYFTILSSIE